MRLQSFMPSDSSLSTHVFSGAGRFSGKRISFQTVHSVSGKYGDRDVEGYAPITYNIDRFNSAKSGWSFAAGLNVDACVPHIGAYNDDFLKAAVDAIRPKQSYDIASTKDSLFDLRAFCYVLGEAASLGTAGTDPLVGLDAAAVHTLSMTYNSPASGEVFVGPKIARSGGEAVTLLRLLKAAGVERATMLTDNVHRGQFMSLTGKSLTAYCMFLFANTLHMANENAVACHHMLAFYRGLHAGLILNAHSDEGGWVRRALRTSTYPPSLGLVRVCSGELCGLPTTAPPTSDGGVGLCFAAYLELSGLWAVSGLDEKGVAAVYRRVEGGDSRPSALPGLQDETYDVAKRFRDLVTDEYGFHETVIADGHSFQDYFSNDKFDDHFDPEVIVPFWYVEPSGLLCSARVGGVAHHGRDTLLPLVASGEVYSTGDSAVVNGRPIGGSSVYVKHGPGNLRGSAMSYIMSATYSTRNGLSQVEYEARADLLTATTDALFVETGVTNGAQRRWVTPHNPCPGSNEAYSTVPLTFEYTYRGYGKEPTLQDWTTTDYHSNVGSLTLCCDGTENKKLAHRFVPHHIKRWIDCQRHGMVTLKTGMLKKVVDPVVPPALPSSYMLPEEIVEPGIEDETPSDPVELDIDPPHPADTEPSDPIAVTLADDAGARPRDESGS